MSLMSSLGGELLEQEKDNTGAAEGKRESGKAERSESVLRSRGKRWCCNKSLGWIKGKRHLAKELVVIREHALNQLESKCLVEVLGLWELRVLSVTQQTKVLEDSEGVTHGRGERLCRPIRKSYRFKLISKQHAVIFLYDLVDDEHDQLAQCHRREGGPISQRIPIGPSVKEVYGGAQNKGTYICEYHFEDSVAMALWLKASVKRAQANVSMQTVKFNTQQCGGSVSFGHGTGGQEQEEKEGTERTEGRRNRGGDAWTDEAQLTRHVTPECAASSPTEADYQALLASITSETSVINTETMSILPRFSHTSGAELEVYHVPQYVITFVEQNREHLQRAAQDQNGFRAGLTSTKNAPIDNRTQFIPGHQQPQPLQQQGLVQGPGKPNMLQSTQLHMQSMGAQISGSNSSSGVQDQGGIVPVSMNPATGLPSLARRAIRLACYPPQTHNLQTSLRRCPKNNDIKDQTGICGNPTFPEQKRTIYSSRSIGKGKSDTILNSAGLFSIVVSIFLTKTIGGLRPNSTELLLGQILLQLRQSANTT
ncbi:hypothetical protein F5888DRAFT_1638989 [Russula emetica]|nr:hypothetical protein F5888DRAFT_1638989 [Russula emetica]